MSDRPDVVFLGPSLSHEQARTLLPGVICLPPAAMGDILGAVTSYQPRSIGLVDGTFLANMSVFHKEILAAIDHGVWLLGASSMGALRAAECAPYGMIGVGEIYQALATGAIEDDDEVALTHGSAESGFRSLSDALVTIRATIAAAEAAGLVSADEATQLISMQKDRWFPERRLSEVSRDAATIGIDATRCEALRAFIRASDIDPKRDDAIALLARIRELPNEPVPKEQRPRTVMSGVFSAMLARDVVVETNDSLTITFDRIRKYAALHDPTYDETMRRTRQQIALISLSLWMGGLPSDDEIQEARCRMAAQVGVPVDELIRWAAEHDVGEGALFGELQNEALLYRVERSWLGRTRMGEITRTYLHQLRLRGDYHAVKGAAALQHAAAKGVTLSPPPSPRRLIASTAALGTWKIPADFEEYVDTADFGSVGEMLDAMSISARAHHALFGIGLVDLADEDSDSVITEDQEPMMTRGR